jgi:hypothetical protein
MDHPQKQYLAIILTSKVGSCQQLVERRGGGCRKNGGTQLIRLCHPQKQYLAIVLASKATGAQAGSRMRRWGWLAGSKVKAVVVVVQGGAYSKVRRHSRRQRGLSRCKGQGVCGISL